MGRRYSKQLAAGLSLFLCGWAAQVSAQDAPERCKISANMVEVSAPCAWSVLEQGDTISPTIIKMGDTRGRLTIWRSEEPVPLKRIARKLRKIARVERWRLKKQRRTRINGKRALAMLFDIKDGAVVSRQLFYFFNTKDERYIMQFGTERKDFAYRTFRKVAASFERRIQSASNEHAR
jgi:hypothetical protein